MPEEISLCSKRMVINPFLIGQLHFLPLFPVDRSFRGDFCGTRAFISSSFGWLPAIHIWDLHSFSCAPSLISEFSYVLLESVSKWNALILSLEVIQFKGERFGLSWKKFCWGRHFANTRVCVLETKFWNVTYEKSV